MIVLSLAIAILFWHRPAQRPAVPETTKESGQTTNSMATNTPVVQAVSVPLQTAIPKTNAELPAADKAKALNMKGSDLTNDTKPGFGECGILVIAPLIGQRSESTT